MSKKKVQIVFDKDVYERIEKAAEYSGLQFATFLKHTAIVRTNEILYNVDQQARG